MPCVVLGQLLLYVISSQVSQRHNNGLEQAENRWTTIVARTQADPVNERTQLDDVVFDESGSMIHAAGRLSGERASRTFFSRNYARRSTCQPKA